jgi:hypothetical protein
MAEIIIDNKLAERLKAIADDEKRAVDDVLTDLLQLYEHQTKNAQIDPLDAMQGAFDDDVNDLSTSVRETMTDYYRQKYDRPS